MSSLPYKLIRVAIMVVALHSVMRAYGEDAVVLTIKNKGVVLAEYTRSDLVEHAAFTELRTNTPWDETVQRYEGVPLRALLNASERSTGAKVILNARNGYKITIDKVRLLEGNPFLAIKLNGEWMRVRDKGPVWLVFPFMERPELDSSFYRQASVWMLSEVETLNP